MSSESFNKSPDHRPPSIFYADINDPTFVEGYFDTYYEPKTAIPSYATQLREAIEQVPDEPVLVQAPMRNGPTIISSNYHKPMVVTRITSLIIPENYFKSSASLSLRQCRTVGCRPILP